MKILMVTRESHADKRYGLGKSLTPVITELEQRGVTVGYLCQADVGERSLRWMRTVHGWLVKLLGKWFKHTEFTSLLWGILERLNMGRLAAKVMRRERYTHVHCHDPIIAMGYRWIARIYWLLQFRRGHTARWGITEHGFGCYAQAFHEDGARLGTATMRWLRRMEANVLLKAHWVVTPTQRGLTQLARDLSIYPMPNTWYAIPHARPRLTLYSRHSAREQLNWTADTLYIIAVGRFAPLKQFPLLVTVCARLHHAQWHLILMGDGDRAPLQHLANELGISERLSFAVSDDMGLYYAAADIYVSTSITEAFGLANLEALIMGIPTLCTAVGGVPEVMGCGSWLIPSDNELALQQALQTLLDDPDSRQHLRRQAQQWAAHWPDIHTVTDAYVAMYQGTSPVKINVTPSESTQPLSQNQLELSFWHTRVRQWQLCPLPKPLVLPSSMNVLLIAPHSDDETLGCGGTLALLRQKGCRVKVAIVTDSSGGDPLGYLGAEEDIIAYRQRESLAAMKILGIDDIVFLAEPDSHYQHHEKIVAQLHALLDSYPTDWLFLPFVLDYHRDHVAITLTLLEVWQQRGCRERIFIYESWSPVPATWTVDISTVFELKKQAIYCYQLPLRYCDYFKAAYGMANYRSLYLTEFGCQYAEALLELTPDSWQTMVAHLLRVREFQENVLQKNS